MGGAEGVPQKTTRLHNSYLVKVATLGEGVKIRKKMTTWFVYGPLYDEKMANPFVILQYLPKWY